MHGKFGDLVLNASPLLVVQDLQRAVDFYAVKLGFRIEYQWDDIALLCLGAMQLYLATDAGPVADRPGVRLSPVMREGASNAALVFHVRDVEAAYKTLVAHGVAFLAPPSSPPWGGQRCFARDPDGYLIEIENHA